MIIRSTKEPLLEIYADAEFEGTWNKETAQDDPYTARSRIGYHLQYAGVPVWWVSKMATEICLSTTEAEYVALSEALRTGIPMLQFLQELHQKGFIPLQRETAIHCKLFEDNDGALELAKVPKMRPRTKHINCKYHHFREFVQDPANHISIHPCASEDQLADWLTKMPSHDLFRKTRLLIQGW